MDVDIGGTNAALQQFAATGMMSQPSNTGFSSGGKLSFLIAAY